MKKEKNLTHNRNFFDAWKNAFNGIKTAIKTQINVKVQIIVAIIAIILGIIFKLNNFEWICLAFAIFLVIVTEMVNTAIEAAVDLCTEEYNEKAKVAKDVGAGAVVLAALNSLIVGYFLFFHKILEVIINKG